MSMIYCDKHDLKWDSDHKSECPQCDADPVVLRADLDCKIPGMSASVVVTKGGMETIRKALAEKDKS